MNERYLLSFDFDKTVANTFKKGPRGIGVNEATENAVRDILGEKGIEQFKKLGGLNNRAPSELIHLILKSDNVGYIESAHNFFQGHLDELTNLVPASKGTPLKWDDKNIEPLISELFVRQKLSYLLSQIGEKTVDGQLWPPLTNGFLEFWIEVQKLKEEGVPLDTAIISSGHDLFIDRVFDLYNLKRPDIIVSKDDIRGRKYPKEIERRVKPGELSLALAHFDWLKEQGMSQDFEAAKEVKQRMMFFGDDPIKDGRLAGDARIHFGFIVPTEYILTEKDSLSTFKDWRTVESFLRQNKYMFLTGESFQKILGVERRVGNPENK